MPGTTSCCYVKGGAAVTDDKYNGFMRGAGVAFDTASDTRWGGTVGAGLEYGFAPNWSVGRRIRPSVHGQATTSTFIDAGIFVPRHATHIRQDVDMVTVRVNYRWGGPVIAKY